MKLFTGWAVSAGLVFAAAAANAQVLAPTGIGPVTRVSDVGWPYATMPPETLPPPINSSYRRAPRPPLPIPHVASRSAPKAPPHAAWPEAAPAQQSAATARPAEPQASMVGVAKPSVQIMPTQDMPAAQGF